MDRLLAAIEEVKRLDSERIAARERRDALLREAQAAGHTYVTLQKATGLSQVTIAKAVTAK